MDKCQEWKSAEIYVDTTITDVGVVDDFEVDNGHTIIFTADSV
jgi:hypothetical protein